MSTLLCEPLARARSRQPARARAALRYLPAVLLAALIVAYSLVFSHMSILRHRTLHSNAFDLGNMNQAVWNTVQGEALRFTNWDQGETRLAAHVEPILLLVALAYRLRPQPETLLVLQSAALALGAIPAYRLARRKLGSPQAGLALAAIYLLNPSLEAANLSDFHAVAMAAPLLLAAWDALDLRRYGLFSLFALLAMATKEEISLIVLLTGLYIAYVHGRRGFGLAVAAFGGAWFFASLYIVIPHYRVGEQSIFMTRYAHLGDGIFAILWNFLLNPTTPLALAQDPDRGRYLPGLLQSVAYLPLLAPVVLALAAGPLAINFFSSFDWMYSGGGHYSASIVALLVVSAVVGAGRAARALAGRTGWTLQRWGMVLSAGALFVVLVDHHQRGFSPLSVGISLPRPGEHEARVQEIARLIPPEAAVSAQTALNPHVSGRRDLYMYPLRVEGADYVFFDVTTSTEPYDVDDFHARAMALLRSGQYRLVAAADGIALLQHEPGAGPVRLPPEFFTFARAIGPPRQPLLVRFADVFELVGYDLERVDYLFGRKQVYRFRLHLRALRPVEDGYRPVLYIARPDGALVNAVSRFPTIAWLPPSIWTPGETYVVTSPPIWVGREGPGNVYLGLLRGTDPWNPAQRLAPITSPFDISAHLFEGASLYRLTRLR